MNIHTMNRLLCCCMCSGVISAVAITPAEVQRKLKDGENITFVDLRSRSVFQTAHIPNAINIPASLVAQKELPPLGTVVVYDDGLGVDTATAAAATLSERAGITALPLEGGFAAWETAQALDTTRAIGLAAEEFPIITYDHLVRAQSNNVTLVDLRKPKKVPANEKGGRAAALPFTDLAAEFPHAKVTRSLPDHSASRKSVAAAEQVPPLLVLIDNGDGSAQQMARTLKANGIKRFAILAGGEEMIVRKGQPGLERMGSSTRQSVITGTNSTR